MTMSNENNKYRMKRRGKRNRPNSKLYKNHKNRS